MTSGKRDAQSIDPINFSQMQHMQTNDVDDVNDSDDKWNALMQNDPDVQDAKTAKSAFRRHRWNSQLRILFVGLAIIALIAMMTGAIIYLAKVFTDETTQHPTPPAATQQQSLSGQEGDGGQDANGGRNPASAPDVSYGSSSTNTTVAIDEKRITLDSETASTVIEMPSLSEPIKKEADCTLVDIASTCYVGTLKAGDKTADLFAFRDAAQSSLLLTDAETDDFTVPGAAIAYRTKVSADGAQKDAAVIVARDQSGIMMVGEQGAVDAIVGGNQIRLASTGKK